MTTDDHNSKEIIVKEQNNLKAGLSDPVPVSVCDPASVSVSVSMDVLNTSLVGVYNKKNEIYEEKNEGSEITEFLVMPTDSPKGGMTIKQLVEEVNKMIVDFSSSSEKLDESQIQDKLTMASQGGVLDKIRVELRQIFLYQQKIDTYNLTSDKKIDKNAGIKSSKKTLEYAINFIILSEITKSKALNINSISLGVWNTTRPSVLNRMQIGNVQQLLRG